jgi:hypothetical protein
MTDVPLRPAVIPVLQNVTTSRQSLDSSALPPLYGTRELIIDIRRLRSAWKRYRKARQRRAIYDFLEEIFQVVAIWRSDGHADGRTRRAMDRRGCKSPQVIEPFRDLIMAMSHPTKLSRRTVAKWTRVLRYAEEYKRPGKPLERFVMRRGGINGCAALYTRRLGRKSQLAKKD